MDILLLIIAATLAGGVLSVLAASFVAYALLGSWAPRMVSFAVGCMLAAAMLDLLPSAIEAGLSVGAAGGVVLVGLMLFFLLEKLALWRHEHVRREGGHTVKPAGPMILIGDGVHNFVDGILLAAAFLQDVWLGIATAIAVIAHEIPQEIGDFMVLLDSGYNRPRALLLNLICSLMAVAGGILGYYVLQDAQAAIPYALALAAASFIYIAMADLMPELHRDRGMAAAPLQIALMAAGIGSVAVGHGVH